MYYPEGKGVNIETKRAKPPRRKQAKTLRAIWFNLMRDLRVWWGR